MTADDMGSILQEHRRGMLRFARTLVPRDAAEDLVQDVIVVMLAHPERWHDKEHVYRGATQALRHRAANHVRNYRLHRDAPLPPPPEPDTPETPDYDVRRALAALSPKDRELVWARYVLGESVAEIAHRLKVHTDTARRWLQRARAKLCSRTALRT